MRRSSYCYITTFGHEDDDPIYELMYGTIKMFTATSPKFVYLTIKPTHEDVVKLANNPKNWSFIGETIYLDKLQYEQFKNAALL